MRKPVITQKWLEEFYAEGIKPKYRASLKQNNLTKRKKYDKGIDNEKIQSKNSRHGNRSSSNNTIRKRTND